VKVLFIALGIFHPEGGMERYNQRVVRVLSELVQGHNIESATVLSLWDDKNCGKVPGIYFQGFGSNKFKALFSFLNRLRIERPDVVLYGHILFAPLALVAKTLYPKCKPITFVYGVEVWEEPSRIFRWICSKAFDNFIAISQYTERAMISAYQLPAERISLLYAATDSQSVDRFSSGSVNLCGKFNILSVCRLSTASVHKNIDKVIKAISEVLKKFPDTHYYIIGDGDWRNDLERLCIKSGVELNVHFTGWVDDLERDAYYMASDIFVLPSVGEGFGIVFLEAWKYQLPVVTSNHGAAPEVVEDGRGGLCVDPEPARIAQAINTLLSDDQMRKRMGYFGNQKLTTFYTHQRFQEQLLQYLQNSIQ
jgi:glycosyltransferase involved in cell wall biosynthesis